MKYLYPALILAALLSLSHAQAGVVDGSPIDAANTNAAFISKNVNDTTPSNLGLASTDPLAGGSVVNLQTQVNAIDSFSGVVPNSVYNVKPVWTNNNVGTTTDSLKDRIEALSGTFVTGPILPIANGGTDASTAADAFDNLSPMTVIGDTIYGGTGGVGLRLPGNSSTTKMYYSETGTGSSPAAPVWGPIATADLPAISITGDGTGTGSAGSIPLTLDTVNSNVGSYTNASITVNAKGLITAASNGASGTVSSVTNSDGSITFSPTTGAVVGSLPSSGVSAGSYTSANITVNSKGIVTSASNGSGGGGSTLYQAFVVNGSLVSQSPSSWITSTSSSSSGTLTTVTMNIQSGTFSSFPVCWASAAEQFSSGAITVYSAIDSTLTQGLAYCSALTSGSSTIANCGSVSYSFVFTCANL